MVLMGRLTVCVLLVTLGCERKAEPSKPAPAPADEVARDIVKAVDELANTPPEPIPAAVKQAAVAPTALLGTWKIKHLVYIKDGKPGAPESPIVEGTWTFADAGRFVKQGGNDLEGTYVLTPDRLTISALGPALEYTVDKVTQSELVVTQMILPDMGTTTVLERVP